MMALDVTPGAVGYEWTTSARLERIEAKLDRLIGGEPADMIPVKEVMRLTGTKTYSSLYRILEKLQVHPFVKGKYRRIEVENAIAKKSLNDRLSQSKS